MAELVQKTVVICLTEEEFYETVGFREEPGVHEFYHVTSLFALNSLDYVTNAIFRQSAKDLSEFFDMYEVIDNKGVTIRWQ